MTWFKVDDGFWGHPKQTALPPAPVALWVRAGSWSGSQLTDGFVPVHMVTMLGAKKRDADQLVTAGLWESVDGGYQFHDWLEFQPTREQVLKERADARARMQRKRGSGSGDVRANKRRTSDDVRLPRPDPSRPDLEDNSVEGASHVSSDSADEPPLYSDRCTRHGDIADPGPCGNCADARKANAAKPEVLPDYRMRIIVPLCGKCDDRWINTPTGAKHCPRCHPAEVTSQQGDCRYHPGHPTVNCSACDEAREAYIKGRTA